MGKRLEFVSRQNLKPCKAHAKDYKELVDNNLIPYGLKFWKPYEINGDKRGYYLLGLSSTASDGYNRAAGMTAAILRRGLDTNSPAYIEIGQRYANRFFGVNELRDYTGKIYQKGVAVNVTGMKYVAAKY